MSISDNYEINVAKKRNDGRFVHWCKIELPDVYEKEAEEKLKFLRELFGDEYKISMTHWECRGKLKDNWM